VLKFHQTIPNQRMRVRHAHSSSTALNSLRVRVVETAYFLSDISHPVSMATQSDW